MCVCVFVGAVGEIGILSSGFRRLPRANREHLGFGPRMRECWGGGER